MHINWLTSTFSIECASVRHNIVVVRYLFELLFDIHFTTLGFTVFVVHLSYNKIRNTEH